MFVGFTKSDRLDLATPTFEVIVCHFQVTNSLQVQRRTSTNTAAEVQRLSLATDIATCHKYVITTTISSTNASTTYNPKPVIQVLSSSPIIIIMMDGDDDDPDDG